MNEHLEKQYHQSLKEIVDRQYANDVQEWRGNGATVEWQISFTPEPKFGKHSGKATFFITLNTTTRTATALYEYVPRTRGQEAHWNMTQDWRD